MATLSLPVRPAALAVRWRWPLLLAWGLAWVLARGGSTGDWHFLEEGGRLLRGPHPLSLYADAPYLQIGPLALLAGVPLAGAPGPVVQAVLYGLGAAAVVAAEVVAPRRSAVTFVAAAALALPSWSFVVGSGHLDDALVVASTACAGVAVARGRSITAGLLVGAAVAAKPWALVVVPVVLGLRTHRGRAVLAALTVPAAAWAPFVVGDPGTAAALTAFRIGVVPTSGLHLLGVGDVACPGWVRPVQVVLGLVLALLAVRQGRWWAAPAAGLAARVALDPGAMGYYAAALAVTVVVVDACKGRRWPVGSLLVFGGLFYPAYVASQAARAGVVLFTSPPGSLLVAAVRVATCVAVVALCCAPPRGGRPRALRLA